MDELEVIQSEGVVTAPEIALKLNKSRVNVWKCIQFYIKIHEVTEVKVRGGKELNKSLYMQNELYKSLFQD